MKFSLEKKPLAILIPGKGDDVEFVHAATSHWSSKGLDTEIFSMGWNSEEAFEPKLARLLLFIDELAQNRAVSIVGISAGGSAALNAFAHRSEALKSGVNVCGRLRAGRHFVRSLKTMSRGSISFQQSVTKFESIEPNLTNQQRNKVLTLRSAIFDELVPSKTSTLEGAQNELIYLPEHMACIFWALYFSDVVINHVLEHSR